MNFSSSTGKRENIHSIASYEELSEDSEPIAKHYHSLTTDSFGVLADVRTGGLKRDLSSAFALKDQEFDDAGYADWLFQERVHYMKNFQPVNTDPRKMVPIKGANIGAYGPTHWKEVLCYPQKANDWLDQEGTDFIYDERVMVVGPQWSLLRDFHNLYEKVSSGTEPTISSNLYHDCGEFSFVRRKGDNSVIFGDTLPNSPGGFISKTDKQTIQQNYNYFSNGNRPEPVNHGISPILVEVKYSHEPYIDEDGSLCLAMFPSFALWNPYDVAIELGSDAAYEIDIKIEHLRIRGLNIKEWEIYKKWRKHQERRRVMAAKAARPPTIPNRPPPRPRPIVVAQQPQPPNPQQPFVLPPITTPFIDLNGNGRRDPGEFTEPPPSPPPGLGQKPYPGGGGGGGGGGGPRINPQVMPRFHYMFWKNFAQSRAHTHPRLFGGVNSAVRAPITWEVNNPNAQNNGDPSLGNPNANNDFYLFADFRARADFPDFPDFYPFNDFDRRKGEKRIPDFRPLGIMPSSTERYARNNTGPMDAPLRLSAKGVRLEPGEKAYFVPSQSITDVDSTAKYKVLLMAKGTEAAGNYLRFKAPSQHFTIPADEPVDIRIWADNVKGYERGDHDQFMASSSSISTSTPNGIVMYLNSGGTRRPIKKINKNFELGKMGSARSFNKASDLMNFQSKLAGSNGFGGEGFRLRWKLPGTSTRMTFHEFNPRALIDGYQDGSGDLWEIEVIQNPIDPGRPERRHREWQNSNFYKDLNTKREIGMTEDGNGTSPDFTLNPSPRSWSNRPYSRNFPRMTDTEAHFGHFHERRQGNHRFSSPRVTLFEISRNPMLSLMQFRHANMNSYSHSPAYVVGNSYATPQVGRYKKWGRVRRLSFQPQAQSETEHPWYQFQRFEVKYWWDGNDQSYNMYPWDETNWGFNLASIRDTDSEHNHQNITMDLSYYVNEALFDGYFLTGIDEPENLTSSDSKELIPNPFRNPRLKPYYRNGEWERTEYAAKSEFADESDNDVAKYQTIAADLLLEGAFNVNSTSVDSWVAHLATLKGQAIKIRNLKDGFDLASGSSQEWNESDLTPFLRISEPTGEGVPAQAAPDKDNDFWTGFVTLTDNQVRTLATKLVEEVKLRGPFLSLSDFVNRRVARMEFSGGNVSLPWLKKEEWPHETRTTAQGLRGPVQAAIAKAELNRGGFQWSPTDPELPETPPARFIDPGGTFHDSSFGLHAVSLQNQHTFDVDRANNIQNWGAGIRQISGRSGSIAININSGNDWRTNPTWAREQVHFRRTIYAQAFERGEAPENLRAVENSATGANMPGWLTQADVLSPLAPILTARSDTFVIRTYGESPRMNATLLKRWCEVTVQRVPDYLKPHVDAPHHRPHEPFADDNFDGIWTDGEEWLDLNLNRETVRSGRLVPKSNGLGTSPDLPGGNTAGTFKVGISKDLKLEPDPELEKGMSSNPDFVSTKGINQRFGRKFRIVKFRWLSANEV